MAIPGGSRIRGFAGRRFLCLSHSRPPREREFLSVQSPPRASVRVAFPRSGSTGRTALPEKGALRFQFSRCRSEEHTSELQSQSNLVCRLLLEKEKIATDLQHALLH